MHALVFDPFAGISGDMILGALLDLGYPEERLRAVARRLGADENAVRIETVSRRGIACRSVRFELPEETGHRHLADVLPLLEAGLADAPEAMAFASRVFRRLAEAEGAVHGTSPDEVHFHEVGAMDAILDIGLAADALQVLGVVRCYTRPIAIGRGWVDIAHGRFPVPAPATARLLEGMPVRETRWEGECTTPTGAAVLAEATGGTEPPTLLRPRASGYGAGARDPEDRPNCLRVFLADVSSEEDTELMIVQSDLDDLAPEYVPPALDAIRAAGAVDVTTVVVGMKKGRTGLRIEALAPREALEAVLEAYFTSTTTIGVRYWPVGRQALPREAETRAWHGSSIRWKAVRLPDGEWRAKPEFDDVVRAARETGRTPLEVRRALDGAEQDRNAPGTGSRQADT